MQAKLAAAGELYSCHILMRQMAYVFNLGGDRPPPTLGRDSESQDEEEDEEENESEDDGARRGKRRHQNHGDADGHDDSDAGEGDDAQWAAVDAFALRKSQAAANSGGGGRFSKIEEEVSYMRGCWRFAGVFVVVAQVAFRRKWRCGC